MDRSGLQIKDGQFVTVKYKKGGLKLCAVESQKAPSVDIVERTSQDTKQVAFCFQCENVNYYPMVDGKSLKMDRTDNLDDSHWFEKINIQDGSHYGLQSVCEPRKYLCMSSATSFCLCETIEDCAVLTDVKKRV